MRPIQQTGAFARDRREVGHAVERTKIGIRAIERAFPLQSVQLVRADGERAQRGRRALAARAFDRALHHLPRPVGRGDVVPEPGHADRIQSGAAAEVDQAAARSKRRIQPAPHLGAHVLDRRIVAARAVVVGGNAVKGLPGVAQLRLGRHRQHRRRGR
jgi:hypothetical protein